MTDTAGDPSPTETGTIETTEGSKRKRGRKSGADSPDATAADALADGKPRSKKRRRPKVESSTDSGGDAPQKSRKARGKRRQDLNQALVFELRTLRASLAQTLESMELRLGGRITELLHGIEGDPGLDQKPKPLTVKAAQAALAEIDALRIKPKRGRLKDIRRIDRTLRALREPRS